MKRSRRFAAAGSAARILAGGTDLLVQMRSGAVKPGVIVDIKKIAEMTAIEQTADGGFRIGAAVSGMALHEHRDFRQGLARRAGGHQPDRLQAGAGPRLGGRQSLQRLARRRQRARDGRGRRHRHRCRAPTAAARCKVEDVPAGPGRTNLKPGEILVSFTLPPRPKGSSDAYLRMIPRTEMDIAVVGVGVSLTIKDGIVHRRPRRPRRGGADRAAGRGRRQGADRLASSTTPRWRRPPPPVPPPAVRSTTSAAPSFTAPRLPACCSSARPRSPPNAPQGIETSWPKLHVTTTINGEPMEFLCEPSRHHARRAARAAGSHRLQGRLRLRRLRRLQHHARRPAGLFLPDARGRGRRPRDQHHRGHGATATSCIRCSRSFSRWRRCSAASAPRACWSPPTRC